MGGSSSAEGTRIDPASRDGLTHAEFIKKYGTGNGQALWDTAIPSKNVELDTQSVAVTAAPLASRIDLWQALRAHGMDVPELVQIRVIATNVARGASTCEGVYSLLDDTIGGEMSWGDGEKRVYWKAWGEGDSRWMISTTKEHIAQQVGYIASSEKIVRKPLKLPTECSSWDFYTESSGWREDPRIRVEIAHPTLPGAPLRAVDLRQFQFDRGQMQLLRRALGQMLNGADHAPPDFAVQFDDGSQVDVHKAVVGSRSGFVQTFLTTQLSGDGPGRGVLKFEGCDAALGRRAVQFMYTAELDPTGLTPLDLASLRQLADKYKIDGLEQACMHAMGLMDDPNPKHVWELIRQDVMDKQIAVWCLKHIAAMQNTIEHREQLEITMKKCCGSIAVAASKALEHDKIDYRAIDVAFSRSQAGPAAMSESGAGADGAGYKPY